MLKDGKYVLQNKTGVIPFSQMPHINDLVVKSPYRMWTMEQTKEARFMPSLVQEQVQVGIIFNGTNKYAKELLKGDVLDTSAIDDKIVKNFVIEEYADRFVVARNQKNDFFTDRESAILFGLPANLIEDILVGRQYEKDKKRLKQIKDLLPHAYICNLDGRVICK